MAVRKRRLFRLSELAKKLNGNGAEVFLLYESGDIVLEQVGTQPLVLVKGKDYETFEFAQMAAFIELEPKKPEEAP